MARVVAWAIVSAVTLGGVALWQYWRVSVRALDEELLADAAALARAVIIEEGFLEVDTSADVRAALSAGASYYSVHDAEGRLIDGDAPPMTPTTAADGPRAFSLRGAREVRVAGPSGTLVRVGRSLAPLRGDSWRLALSIAVASIVTLLLAIPLVIWLRRSLAASLLQFDRTARALAPGRPARIALAGVDRELAGAARRLNDAFDRLEEGLRREQQLTADASHELRTPVSVLLVETEWALGRDRSPDEYRSTLQVCRRQARRLDDLIESLLVLARLESGVTRPERAPVDLGAVVDAAIDDVTPAADARGVVITREGTGVIDGDRVQVASLVANLLGNAVRYNRDAGRVDVSIRTGSDGVRLEVRDTGTGLDDGMVARVFDRFWRADPARAADGQGGTGLGLAICKAIAEAHGGRITCRSSDQGTILEVWFAVVRDEHSSRRASS